MRYQEVDAQLSSAKFLADVAEEFLKDFCNQKTCRPGLLQIAIQGFRERLAQNSEPDAVLTAYDSVESNDD